MKVRIGFEQLDPRILPDMGVKVSFLADEPANRRRRAAAGPEGSGAGGHGDVGVRRARRIAWNAARHGDERGNDGDQVRARA